jgi:pimeloyl-ACP methyl ester carboxylesterase
MTFFYSFASRELLFCVFLVMSSSVAAVDHVATLQSHPQFWYRFPIEVVHGANRGFQLSPDVEARALEWNNSLNLSRLFDTSLLCNTKKVREFLLKEKRHKANQGQLVTLQTSDGFDIFCTYFDRGSNKLLIVGEGFTNEREKVAPFVDMFPDYDIVLFDFRGHGYRPFTLSDSGTWPLSISKYFFGIDTKKTKLGGIEELDVFAVVDGFKKIKNYEQVYGLGVCYSAFIFLKAQACRPDLFDKLILDGCWVSIPLLVEKIKKDPKLICVPQTGGFSDHWLLGNTMVKDFLYKIAKDLMGLPLSDGPSVVNFAHQLQEMPILMIHGKNDLMVVRNEFEELWDALPIKNKTALVTSNPHVRNHIKQKELYKLVCDLFFELDSEHFLTCLQDVHALIEYKIAKIRKI